MGMVGRGTRTWRRAATLVGIVTVVLVATAGVTTVGAVGTPTASVTPSTGLRDLQVVQVDGAGFTAQSPVFVNECKTGGKNANGCDFATLTFGAADGSGAVHVSMKARRIINVGQRQLDCATPGACVVRVASETDPGTVDVPVSFDPSIPAVLPTVTVTPATGLADHQLVRLDGAGFNPGASALLLECKAQQARRRDGACQYATNRSALIRADGTFTVKKFAVARMLSTESENSDSGGLDCATKVGRCVILVETEDLGGATTVVPLGFNPALPPVVSSSSVAPATRLTDHEMVTVTGRGFLPGEPVTVIECATGSEVSFGGCDYGTTANVTAGFGGKLHVSLPVERLIAPPIGVTSVSTVDCAASATSCVLFVEGESDALTEPLALSFNAGVPAQTAAVRVQPSTGLDDNQRIAATGSGFAPFSTVALLQCSADALDGDLTACDPSSVQNVTAGADGRISGSIDVHVTIGGYEGLEDCTKSAGECVVAAVEGGLSPGGIGVGFVISTGGSFPLSSLSTPDPVAPPVIHRAARGQTLPGVAATPITFG
jgi:hypothetical protein